MAELRDELAAVQRKNVSAAQIQRAVALFDPSWDLFLVPERFRILHPLLKSVVYDGATGELELSFYPLGLDSLSAGTPEAEPSAQGVKLRIPTHLAAPSHALLVREGPKPTRPRGRIPRVARLLALALDPVWDMLLVSERFHPAASNAAVFRRSSLAQLEHADCLTAPLRIGNARTAQGGAPFLASTQMSLRSSSSSSRSDAPLGPGRRDYNPGGA